MDTSSRTSVALVGVLCQRLFKIAPLLESRGPDLADMLARCDAALIIGDNALLLDHRTIAVGTPAAQSAIHDRHSAIEKIDLGDAWTAMTGLPFVWAFWAGRPDALNAADLGALHRARDAGVNQPDAIAREYFPDSPVHQEAGAQYLRDNIKYSLGDEERAGLEAFYRYAAEAGLVPSSGALRFYADTGT
jgi:predicted solute-binding protein